MNVQCNWKVTTDRSINDAVFVTKDTDAMTLENDIQVENCVMLEAPDKDCDGLYPTVPACQLLISCPPMEMSRISVICEARVMEVYGHHGEYLKTVRNELMEETDDMVAFVGEVYFDRPVSLCSLKFISLRSPSEMWLFGIKIYTTQSQATFSPQSPISLDALDHRFNEGGVILSDRAEAFKNLVQNYQRCQNGNIEGMMSNMVLGSLLGNKSNGVERLRMEMLQKGDVENNVAGLKIGERVHEEGKDDVKSPQRERTAADTQTDEEYVNVEQSLKDFISQKLEDFDKKLSEKVDKRFQEIEAKLTCKMEEIESFVKPHGVSSQ